MPRIYDDLDLEYSWNGDFSLSGGDLADTSYDYLQSLLQDVQTVCAAELGDWETLPGLGAQLSDFVGEPNDKYTANLISDRVRVALVSAGIVAEKDLSVRVVPVHIHRVLIIVKIDAVATPYNSLDANSALVASFIFDFLERGISFMDQTPQLIGGG